MQVSPLRDGSAVASVEMTDLWEYESGELLLKHREMVRRKNLVLGSEFVEEFDGCGAVVVESVVDVLREVVVKGRRGERKEWLPVPHDSVDVGETIVAAVLEIFDELRRCCAGTVESVVAYSPDGSYPG